jgi:Papain-like cysteine protease AvrRpt2
MQRSRNDSRGSGKNPSVHRTIRAQRFSAMGDSRIPLRMASEVILPVPHVSQGARPWCWAACARMVIGYFRALKFTPSLEELVEFGHRLPAGVCAGDDVPDVVNDGNTVVTMRVLMSYLGRRAVERCRPGDSASIASEIAAGNPVILHVWSDRDSDQSHVVVARGVRRVGEAEPRSIEFLLNDPAQAEPFWWPCGLLEREMIEWLVVRKDVGW